MKVSNGKDLKHAAPTQAEVVSSRRWYIRLFRGSPTKPGETYGAPGSRDTYGLSIFAMAVFFAVWWFVTDQQWVKPLFVPSPGSIIDSFITISSNGYTGTPLWEHILISTARVFSAFMLACLIGVPLGLSMGTSRFMRGVFDPFIEFYRPIPPLAYLPLMIIWFGIGETSKILLIFLSVFAPVVLGARAGVRSAAIEQIHAAYSFGASHWQVLRHIVLPAATPEILTAMRVGIGFGWTTLVAAEMVAAKTGIGYMVLSASQFLQTAVVIMGIIIIAIIAYLFDLIMRGLERKLVPWKGKA